MRVTVHQGAPLLHGVPGGQLLARHLIPWGFVDGGGVLSSAHLNSLLVIGDEIDGMSTPGFTAVGGGGYTLINPVPAGP
jgi:hypothetical protein